MGGRAARDESGKEPGLTKDTRFIFERAERAFHRGQLRDTIDLLELALAFPEADTALVRVMLGVAYARTHVVERALEHLERAVALAPESFAPHCALGELYLRLCFSEQARPHLNRALELAAAPEERAYVRRLLKDERDRDQCRHYRPSFRHALFLPSRASRERTR